MQRRKTIKIIAMVASAVFVIALVGWAAQFPYRENQYENRMKKLDERIDYLSEQAEIKLNELDQLISKLPLSPEIISKLETEFIEIHKNGEDPKPYLWLITEAKHEDLGFQFGIPKKVFEKLNLSWRYRRGSYIKNRVATTRHEFLSKYLSQQGDVTSPEFEGKTVEMFGNKYGNCVKSPIRTFSKVISGSMNEKLGTLYLQLDDSANKNLYLWRGAFERDDLFSVLQPIFGVIGGISILFLWGLLPTWVYIDAKERGEKNAGIWSFLTFISLFFGLTFYLILRPAELRSLICPKCQKKLDDTKSYCPHCGTNLDETFCPECQYPIKPDWNFCPSCQYTLERKE